MNCRICETKTHLFMKVSTDELSEPFLDQTLRQHLPELKLCRCFECGCLWANDARQNDEILMNAYQRMPDSYFESDAVGPRHAQFYGSLERLMKDAVAGRTILDVGCGDGSFLSALSGDWTKQGLEPSRSGADLSRKKNLEVVCATPDATEKPNKVDLVSALDVIEHVIDPHSFIESLKKHLKPDGAVLLLTGDANSYAARTAGARWSYLRWCGHISIFSELGLRKLLQSHGLEIIDWRRCEHPSSSGPLAWWRVHLLEPLRRLLGRNRSWYPFWRDHQTVVARLTENSGNGTESINPELGVSR
jgi:2-polyprenyl-3-methyl-5-hydroxy-6-metoxy-1,4-benzoquinol methylase